MSDLRKLSEAATPGTILHDGPSNEIWGGADNEYTISEWVSPADGAYICALWNEHRSGSLIPRSEYERVLALLAEAREALRIAKRAQAAIDDAHDQDAGTWGLGRLYEAEQIVHAAGNAASATLSRIDDALAAEREAQK